MSVRTAKRKINYAKSKRKKWHTTALRDERENIKRYWTVENPVTLYHGSMYKQTELMSGYKRSGKLQTWDGVESNLNLYVSSDKREAELLAVGSAAEKVFDTDRFIEADGSIWLFTKEPIAIEDVLNLEVYIYTIPYREKDMWIKNNNPHNNIDTEYTTRKTITGISVEPIDVRALLQGKTVTLTTAPPDVRIDLLQKRYSAETKVYKI